MVSYRLLAGLAAAVLPASASAAGAPTPGWPECVARTTPIAIGLKETGRARDGRLLTLTLRSKAMEGTQKVNVLLPDGYATSPKRRYPVLYLLHGAGGSYADWAQHGVAKALGSLKAIVVMPDGGSDGSYSDWVAVPPGRTPVPAYESYDIHELVPFVDARFRTIADGAGRAVAGLSMGGHGAMKYAAEYPGLFGYAGSFSGAVDPQLPVYQSFIKQCTWGDPAVDGVVWRDNDPTALAGNLRGVRLFARTGNGKVAGQPDDLVETVVGQMNTTFKAALDRAGVPIDFAAGDGNHTWPYWERAFGSFVTWWRAQLKRPVVAPRTFSMVSAHTEFSGWGWAFSVTRGVREQLYLNAVGASGLRVTGSGSVRVVTPAGYRLGGKTYKITGAGARALRVRADARGRLRFTVDLGPAHTEQQTAFDAAAIRTWRTATVRVASRPS
jgi:diacylglycerol O-acyltransferase / trehalose O-mycolyltransferase